MIHLLNEIKKKMIKTEVQVFTKKQLQRLKEDNAMHIFTQKDDKERVVKYELLCEKRRELPKLCLKRLGVFTNRSTKGFLLKFADHLSSSLPS